MYGFRKAAVKNAAAVSLAGLVAGLAFSATVRADDASTASIVPAFAADAAVTSDELAGVRGMQNTFEGMLEATLSDNSANSEGSVRTNTISVDAFDGASGVATVVQNAGDNVIIQTITMVTVNYN